MLKQSKSPCRHGHGLSDLRRDLEIQLHSRTWYAGWGFVDRTRLQWTLNSLDRIIPSPRYMKDTRIWLDSSWLCEVLADRLLEHVEVPAPVGGEYCHSFDSDAWMRMRLHTPKYDKYESILGMLTKAQFWEIWGVGDGFFWYYPLQYIAAAMSDHVSEEQAKRKCKVMAKVVRSAKLTTRKDTPERQLHGAGKGQHRSIDDVEAKAADGDRLLALGEGVVIYARKGNRVHSRNLNTTTPPQCHILITRPEQYALPYRAKRLIPPEVTMDVISVAASVIAIGQAIGAIPKIVDAIRTFAHVNDELAALLNEALRLSIQNSVDVLSPANSVPALAVPEPPLLASARHDFQILIGDLQNLTRRASASAIEVHVAVEENLPTEREGKSDLHEHTGCIESALSVIPTVGPLLSSKLNTHGKLLLEIHAITTASCKALQADLRDIREQLQSSSTVSFGSDRDSNDSPTATDETSQEAMSNNTRVANEDNADQDSPQCEEQGPHDRSVQVDTELLYQRKCVNSCRCQCHSSRTDYQSPGWIQPLLGRLFFNYRSLPVPRRWTCDRSDCFGPASSVRFSYTFPRWAWDRCVCLTYYKSGLVGAGAFLHFSVPRIFPEGSEPVVAWVAAQRAVTTGRNRKRRLNSGSETGLSLTTFTNRLSLIRAREILALEESDKGIWSDIALQLIASQGDDEEEATTREIHRAILRGSDVSAVLDKEPWTLNSRDELQRTPLVLACQVGNLKAASYLIQSGAQLKTRDYYDITHTIGSIKYGRLSLATELLENGAHGNRDIYGRQAMRFNLRQPIRGTGDFLKLLINRPDIPACSYLTVQTSLHYLCTIHGPEPLVEECFETLIKAGANLVAREAVGRTPLLTAIVEGNPLTLRLLANAGARLDALTIHGYNVLHLVALWAEPGTLRFVKDELATKLVGVIDLEAQSRRGYTPLNLWRWRMTAQKVALGQYYRPTDEETKEFEALIRDVRDRTLQADINDLEGILDAIDTRDAAAAREISLRLLGEKRRLRKEQDAETLRVLGIQIQEGMWDAAQETVEEMIQVRKECMADKRSLLLRADDDNFSDIKKEPESDTSNDA
ncbi:hypothetical protein QBC46DRAFT_453439 [Diplogelasinospora grovesii]|uniref:Ankyrin n=1 Tax=Diplogelasinospora grovesii TaxID=303347 RepID=A0AAN6MXU5_9PEZI|nr:hypothetical protein QBC46DRAFT_453439 [Diplogelasinospora grovesii]